MFVLNTISGNSNTGPADALNNSFITENKITSLESLLKSLYLNDSDLNKEGLQLSTNLDNTSIDAIKQQIALAREEESNILSMLGDPLENDLLVRYNEIKNGLLSAEQGIKEYEESIQRKNDFFAAISSLGDNNLTAEQKLKIRTELLDKIPAIKNEAWFKIFLEDAEKSISKINEDTQSLQKQLDELNQTFISILAGDSDKSNQDIKDQILKAINSLSSLNNEKNFLNQIKNIASADSDSESKVLDDAKKGIASDLQKSLQTEQVFAAMYKRMELQALETVLMVRGEPTYKIPGVENNLEAITEALNAAKADEAKLRDQSGITLESNAAVNLTFAKKMNEIVDRRITDLKDAEQFLIEANQIFYKMLKAAGYPAPDSFYYEDPNLITTKLDLQKVEEYKKGMEQLEAYWNQVMIDNKLINTLQLANNTSPSIKAIVKGTEKKVIDLKAIFDFMSDRESVESLESRESSVKYEIETEIKKLASLISNSPTYITDRKHILDKVAGLKASLSSIIQQKSYSKLMSQIEGSVKESLSKESIFQSIYSR